MSLMTPIIEGWRAVLFGSLLVGALTATALLLSKREYRASMTLATIANPRGMSVPGGLGALLNAASAGGGLQATPAFIAQLATQHGVLYRVAHSPMADSGGSKILDRMEALNGGRLDDRDIVPMMRRRVDAKVDPQTGAITISVISTDSALARAMAGRLVDEVSRTFVRAAKAQAAEVRRAMETRVDSAARRLHRAEEGLRAFLSANRSVMPYSPQALTRQELQREVDIAQTVYTQVVTDREAAIGKELEDTPAVLVVDPIPRSLLREPRRAAVKTIAATLLAGFLISVLLLVRSSTRAAMDASTDDAGRFVAAVRSIPVIGPLALRLLVPTPVAGQSAQRVPGRGPASPPTAAAASAPRRRSTVAD